MKTLMATVILIITSCPVFAQNRGGSNFPGTGGGNTGGTGSGVGQGGLTGAQPGSGSGFGSGFSFDPSFGGTTFANPFGNSAGNAGMRAMGLGMGMGMGMGMGGMGGMGMGGMGMGGMGMGGMGGMGMGRSGMQQQSQTKVRPTVVLGFEVARPSPQQRAQQVQLNLTRLPQPQRFAGVTVQMEGSRAVVFGSLKEPKDAELLRQLLLLEPGVFQVDMQQMGADSSEESPSNRNSSSRIQDLQPELVPSSEIVPAPRD